MAKCATCSKGFEKNSNITVCVVCNKFFHPSTNCALVNPTEERVLILKGEKVLSYICHACKDNGNIHVQVKDAILEMQATLTQFKEIPERLESIERQLVPLKNISEEFNSFKTDVNTKLKTFNNSVINEAVDEIYLRELKSKNIIFYNIPDPNDKEEDLKLIKKILSKSKIIVNIKNVIRFGSFDQTNTKPRPLLLKLKEKREVSYCFTNKKKILNQFINLEYKEVKMLHDQTKLQADNMKKIYKEKEEREKKGENLVVKFSLGQPKLFKVADDQKTNQINKDLSKNQ